MNVFDQYLVGNFDNIKFNFGSFHLQDRLNENNISRECIEHIIKTEEPVFHDLSKPNVFEVFFEAPETKNYDYLKVIFKCKNNNINVITLYPDNSVGSNKHQTKFNTQKHKNVKHKVSNAHSQRKRMN